MDDAPDAATDGSAVTSSSGVKPEVAEPIQRMSRSRPSSSASSNAATADLSTFSSASTLLAPPLGRNLSSTSTDAPEPAAANSQAHVPAGPVGDADKCAAPPPLEPSLSALGTPAPGSSSSSIKTSRRPSSSSSQRPAAAPSPRPSKPVRTSSATPSSSRRAVGEAREPGALPKFIRDPVLVTKRPWSSTIPASTSSGMYSYMAPIHGQPPPPLKAHTASLVGNKIYIIGGSISGSGGCFRGVATFNIDTMQWSIVKGIAGDAPPPIRAHTATAVGSAIYVFAGGDGTAYHNDLYKFDTVTLTWSKPAICPRPASATADAQPPKRSSVAPEKPSPRRAHSAALWGTHKIVIFGGGDGGRALNDTWIYDCEGSFWERVECRPSDIAPAGEGRRRVVLPPDRGYHTCICTLDDKLVVQGGSDGSRSFSSLDVLDLKTKVWHRLDRTLDGEPVSRAFHATVLVGNYLFSTGGHDGRQYAKDILAFDLRRKRWTKRKVGGKLPTPERGYHSLTHADGRLYVFGGSDGNSILGDMWIIELGTAAVLALEPSFGLDFTS